MPHGIKIVPKMRNPCPFDIFKVAGILAFVPDFIGPMAVGIKWFLLPFQLFFLLSLCLSLVVLQSEL